jgi:hypothetical protein
MATTGIISALFRDFTRTHRIAMIPYRCFGTIFGQIFRGQAVQELDHLQGGLLQRNTIIIIIIIIIMA